MNRESKLRKTFLFDFQKEIFVLYKRENYLVSLFKGIYA